MRICIDIDGTICITRKLDESYHDVKPIPGAIEHINKLKADGHYIILYSSRHMKTCDNNLGRIIAIQGNILLPWLNKHNIPYDEVWFGKPLADIYIDDRAVKFDNWNDTYNTINA
jgi:capsule biosynthesis phosphatase